MRNAATELLSHVTAHDTSCCNTGGDFEPALLQQPFGISRTDAVGFIVKGFQAAVTGCQYIFQCIPALLFCMQLKMPSALVDSSLCG